MNEKCEKFSSTFFEILKYEYYLENINKVLISNRYNNISNNDFQ